MFPGIGTLINVVAILLGSTIGVISGSKFKESTRQLMTDILGCITFIGAASAITSLWKKEFVDSVPQGAPILIVLFSLILGGLIGARIDVERRLEEWGVALRRRFDKSGKSPFIEGFVTSSLIFAIGPLAILGSISDGMGNGIDQLALKSLLDFFASIAFAAAFGWGVALSILPVGIYQGVWTAAGFFLGSVLSPLQVSAMTATGGVILLGIAFKLLNIKSMAVGNLLPALAIAPVAALLISTL